jgi:regulator of nonsense transcripts 2
VLRKLRRLAWASDEAYVVRTMIAAAKGRFTDLPLVASLAAGLARYHPSLGVALPDALLEEARPAACKAPSRLLHNHLSVQGH